jgi:hypothetical protein
LKSHKFESKIGYCRFVTLVVENELSWRVTYSSFNDSTGGGSSMESYEISDANKFLCPQDFNMFRGEIIN